MAATRSVPPSSTTAPVRPTSTRSSTPSCAPGAGCPNLSPNLLRRMIPADIATAAATPYAPLIGAAALMRCAFYHEDLRPVGESLLARAQANPDDANAWFDASFVL